MDLPVESSQSLANRLKEVNKTYTDLVTSNVTQSVLSLMLQTTYLLTGHAVKPSLTTLKFHSMIGTTPVLVTNLPFDEEGFSLGSNNECCQYSFTNGCNLSSTGW